MMTPEKFSEYQQKQLQALHDLTLKYVSSVQALTELHLQHTKESLDTHSQQQQEWLQVKNWHDWLELQNRTLQPLTEKWTGYTHNFYDILLDLGQELGRLFQHQPTAPQPAELALPPAAAPQDPQPTATAASTSVTAPTKSTGNKSAPTKPAA